VLFRSREIGAGEEPFTVGDVHRRTNARPDSVREYVVALFRAGYLEVSGEQPRPSGTPAKLYVLKRSPQDAPRLRPDGTEVSMGSAREQMWRTMRMLGTFTLKDLIVAASTEAVTIKESDARDYLSNLRKAGYLVSKRQAIKGGPAVFRMLPGKYTGPKPPMVQRVQQVFDPNLGKVVWPKDGER